MSINVKTSSLAKLLQEKAPVSTALSVDRDSLIIEQAPKKSLFQKVRGMKSWLSFTILMVCGLGILLSPCVFYANNETLPVLSMEVDLSKLMTLEYQMVRWSIFLASSYLVLIVSAFFLSALPFIVVTIVVFLFSKCKQRLRQRLVCMKS
jgi:hypothetical protein